MLCSVYWAPINAFCFFLQYCNVEASDQDWTRSRRTTRPRLSTKVQFVRFDPVDQMLSGDKRLRLLYPLTGAMRVQCWLKFFLPVCLYFVTREYSCITHFRSPGWMGMVPKWGDVTSPHRSLYSIFFAPYFIYYKFSICTEIVVVLTGSPQGVNLAGSR